MASYPKIFLLCFFVGLSTFIYSQDPVCDSVARSFHQQLTVFPQEKLHLHTDKPYYITGEHIWFRAYLAEAAHHHPAPFSRYVYVELINPMDSIVARIRIRPDEDTYHGHVPIPEDIPEGHYTLRAYTRFMENAGEDYFFTKTIRIADPQVRLTRTETRFEFTPDHKITTAFRFRQARSQEAVIPENVSVRLNGGRPHPSQSRPQGSRRLHLQHPRRFAAQGTAAGNHP